MATRLYISQTEVPSVSPAFDAVWDVTGSAIRRYLQLSKTGLFGSATVQINVLSGGNTPAGASDVLHVQAISPPLDSNQTISGNFKGQVIAGESNAAADMRAQVVAWVYTGAGSRGTLYAGDAAALANEVTVQQTFTNRKFPRGGSTALSSVAAQTGDRIVIEYGLRKHENATTARNSITYLGDDQSLTDLPEDETDTNRSTKVPWFEFDGTITFAVPTLRATQVTRRAIVTPDDAVLRATQVSRRVIVKDAVVIPNHAKVIWID